MSEQSPLCHHQQVRVELAVQAGLILRTGTLISHAAPSAEEVIRLARWLEEGSEINRESDAEFEARYGGADQILADHAQDGWGEDGPYTEDVPDGLRQAIEDDTPFPEIPTQSPLSAVHEQAEALMHAAVARAINGPMDATVSPFPREEYPDAHPPQDEEDRFSRGTE